MHPSPVARRGRPPKPATQRKVDRVSVALSPDEHNRVCLMALKLRMDVSEYIRLMVIPQPVPTFGSERNTNST